MHLYHDCNVSTYIYIDFNTVQLLGRLPVNINKYLRHYRHTVYLRGSRSSLQWMPAKGVFKEGQKCTSENVIHYIIITCTLALNMKDNERTLQVSPKPAIRTPGLEEQQGMSPWCNPLEFLPFSWKTGNPGWKNQMIRAIPFGKLQKIWTEI